MLKKEIRIGAIYKAQVSNKLVSVRIMSLCPIGGWYAVNLSTHKQIRVKSAQRLRYEVPEPTLVEIFDEQKLAEAVR